MFESDESRSQLLSILRVSLRGESPEADTVAQRHLLTEKESTPLILRPFLVGTPNPLSSGSRDLNFLLGQDSRTRR